MNPFKDAPIRSKKPKPEPKPKRVFKKFVGSQAWLTYAKMPPLSNWPDESIPFSFDQSEVLKWLLDQPEILQYVFDKGRTSGAIHYDHSTKLWKGVNHAS